MIYIAAIVATLIAGAYALGRQDGGAACQARWQEAARRELTRQLDEQAAAKTAERARIAELTDRIRRRDDMIEVLRDEADGDPGADQCGIGADGVRRLNRLRAAAP